MSISTHNSTSDSFSPGDTIVVSSNGGVYRTGTIIPPDTGTSGNPITYEFDSDVVMSCPLQTTWTNYSGNVWQSTQATGVDDLHYDDVQGEEQVSIGACTSEGDWYQTGGVLYLNSGGSTSEYDPDTRYTAVEVTLSNTNEAILIGECAIPSNIRDYLNFHGNGAEIKYRGAHGIKTCCGNTVPGTDILIKGFVVHDILYGISGDINTGIRVQDYSNVTVSECEVYRCQWNAISYWNGMNDTANETSGAIVEKCYVHDNPAHGSIDFQIQNGYRGLNNATVRYCRSTGSTGGVGFYNNNSDTESMHNVHIHHNLFYATGQWGINCFLAGDGEYFQDLEIYNNVCYGNGTTTTGGGINVNAVGAKIYNNICSENNVNENIQAEIRVTDGGGTPNDVDYNCVYHSTFTNLYAEDGTGYTHSAYQSFGQQEHGINADPKFVDPENGNFELQSDSPCIGAADDQIGAAWEDALLPGSTWPFNVNTASQEDY